MSTHMCGFFYGISQKWSKMKQKCIFLLKYLVISKICCIVISTYYPKREPFEIPFAQLCE